MEFLELMNIISAPWKYSIDDIIEKYQVSLNEGLSASEVSKRKQKYGKNILKEKEKKRKAFGKYFLTKSKVSSWHF